MRRRWFYVLTIALLIAFACPDALAVKKSRGGKKSPPARAKRESRGKASRNHVAKSGHVEKSARGAKDGRSRKDERSAKDGRSAKSISRREKKLLSRRERRELARSERGGRERYVVRGRNGRRYVRYRTYKRNDAEVAAAPAAPRPASGIPTERVTEIQHALIKAGYLQDAATGLYDEITIQAMKQFQAASGLPQTGTPTAATLKKLGVSKRSNDGYAVPVNRVSESERKPPSQSQ